MPGLRRAPIGGRAQRCNLSESLVDTLASWVSIFIGLPRMGTKRGECAARMSLRAIGGGAGRRRENCGTRVTPEPGQVKTVTTHVQSMEAALDHAFTSAACRFDTLDLLVQGRVRTSVRDRRIHRRSSYPECTRACGASLALRASVVLRGLVQRQRRRSMLRRSAVSPLDSSTAGRKVRRCFSAVIHRAVAVRQCGPGFNSHSARH
jgi:hypothetical protein